MFRVYLLWRVAIFGEIGIWLRCFAVYASQECIRVLSFRLLAWGRDERRPPPQILSFLPPCLHSKSMTSGVSGSGGDQPIGVELRTDRSLSPFCCSGQSATKEGCWGLIPINLPGAEGLSPRSPTSGRILWHHQGCEHPWNCGCLGCEGKYVEVMKRTIVRPKREWFILYRCI